MLGSRRKREEDRYREVGKIGEGGDALVSRRFDAALHRVVAVKQLKATGSGSAAARAFLREARLVCFLDHPGIAPVYDRFDGPGGEPCYAMKLIAGETLSGRIGFRSGQRPRALPVAEAVAVVHRIAETLAYAHDRGVLHLDVKPDNVMLGRYGEVFLMDWGNARLHDPGPYREALGVHASAESIALLADEPPDLLSGTPHFMSPEQTRLPRDRLGPASDQFSLGVVLFLLLTGRLPFLGKDVKTLLRAIREDAPPAIGSLNPEVPRRLAEIGATRGRASASAAWPRGRRSSSRARPAATPTRCWRVACGSRRRARWARATSPTSGRARSSGSSRS
jgi:serine/threonine protein kinase